MNTKRNLKSGTWILLALSTGFFLFVIIFAGTANDALRVALDDISAGDLNHAVTMIEFARKNSFSFLGFHLVFILVVIIKCGIDLAQLRCLTDEK